MSVILVLSDFGHRGPYVGEMLAVLAREAPGIPAIALMSDLPAFDARSSSYLLAALVERYPRGTVVLVVVDPGVGTTSRRPVWLNADGRMLVGPDNGLFAVAGRRATSCAVHEILWRPAQLSASFHGRDLFAPVAAALAQGRSVASRRLRRSSAWSRRWPESLDAVIYVDGFGNAITGRRGSSLPAGATLRVGGQILARAGTFADVAPGTPFWYVNSMGLVEIAVNQASAQRALGLQVGTSVEVG